MGKFNKDIYMKGCHLMTSVCGDTRNMYQFIFNPDTVEFSDIYPCEDGLDFEIEKDGWYRIVTFRNPNAVLVDGAIRTGNETYTSEDIMDDILREETTEWNPLYLGDWEVDDIFSICKLKKCLADLEYKAFQEMLENCGKSKCKSVEDIKSQRDFLFIAVWLIEHYTELGKIEMAQAIYDRLKGCGDLCQGTLKDKRSCGCNG